MKKNYRIGLWNYVSTQKNLTWTRRILSAKGISRLGCLKASNEINRDCGTETHAFITKLLYLSVLQSTERWYSKSCGRLVAGLVIRVQSIISEARLPFLRMNFLRTLSAFPAWLASARSSMLLHLSHWLIFVSILGRKLHSLRGWSKVFHNMMKNAIHLKTEPLLVNAAKCPLTLNAMTRWNHSMAVTMRKDSRKVFILCKFWWNSVKGLQINIDLKAGVV